MSGSRIVKDQLLAGVFPCSITDEESRAWGEHVISLEKWAAYIGAKARLKALEYMLMATSYRIDLEDRAVHFALELDRARWELFRIAKDWYETNVEPKLRETGELS